MNISYWPLYSTGCKETRTTWLLWERIHVGRWRERHWTLSWRIDSQTAVGLGEIKSLPNGWNLRTYLYLCFHWIKIVSWKSVHPIEYKVYNEYIIWSSLFNKRQRNEEKMIAMKKEKGLLCLLAGKTVTSFLKDWFSNCCRLGRHLIAF